MSRPFALFVRAHTSDHTACASALPMTKAGDATLAQQVQPLSGHNAPRPYARNDIRHMNVVLGGIAGLFAPAGGGGNFALMLAWKVVEGTCVLMPPLGNAPGAGAGASPSFPKDAETAARP